MEYRFAPDTGVNFVQSICQGYYTVSEEDPSPFSSTEGIAEADAIEGRSSSLEKEVERKSLQPEYDSPQASNSDRCMLPVNSSLASIPTSKAEKHGTNGHGNPPWQPRIHTMNEKHSDSGETSNISSNCQRQSPDDVGSDKRKSVEADGTKENNETSATTEDENGGSPYSDLAEDEKFTSPSLRWYNPIRNFCGKIVNTESFQIFIVFLIVLNAIMMGIGTYDFVEKDPSVEKAFAISDTVFLSIFTVECFLQIGYHGYELFFDGWLTFDLFVVVLSWSLESMQVLRAVRVFRAFRLMARLEVLRELVAAIVAVLPRIGSIMLLFLLVQYVFSVLCTVLFGGRTYGPDNLDYFRRLDDTVFTLFQFITLDNWGQIARSVIEVYPWAQAVFLTFMMISAFILYSLVVAVVCNAVAVIEHPDIAVQKFQKNMKKEKIKTRKRVRRVEKQLDELSAQQMEILLSVQNRLMKLESFRRDAREFRLRSEDIGRSL